MYHLLSCLRKKKFTAISAFQLIQIFNTYQEHNFSTIRNIPVVLDRFIEQVSAEYCFRVN